jgi:TetR/AcrR family transcriptional regulator, transcriptional repressor for nem operon
MILKIRSRPMPYTAEHKQETRTRIIKSARRLFNRNGFTEVTIDQIMDDAGLTRGGFYKHFAAKEDLYQAAVLQFICNDVPEQWQRKHIDPQAQGRALARMIVDAYLSRDHYDDRDASCPMIALPSDVARGNGAVKAAFRQVLEMMVTAFEAGAPDNGPAKRQRALAVAATVIGGMVLARALDDRKLGDAVRRSARHEVMERTGWDDA